jgi:hypothetical protein
MMIDVMDFSILFVFRVEVEGCVSQSVSHFLRRTPHFLRGKKHDTEPKCKFCVFHGFWFHDNVMAVVTNDATF